MSQFLLRQVFRTIEEKIGYPAPLPNMGEAAELELAKPKIEMKMEHINTSCKAHIKTLTGTNGYITPKEWNNYCRTIVENYPVLANEGHM